MSKELSYLQDKMVICSDPVIWRSLYGNVINQGLSLVIMASGSIRFKTRSGFNRAEGQGLLLCPLKASTKDISVSEDFSGRIIMLSPDFTDKLHLDSTEKMIWQRSGDTIFIKLSKERVNVYQMYVNVIADAVENYSNDNDNVIWLLTKALSYKISDEIDTDEEVPVSYRKDSLAKEFLKLVNRYGCTQRSLDYYANILCVSPKYLSNVISRATGKKALQWMKEYTLREARKLLKSTSMTISEVSDKLNFPTPSDFCRYFRKNEGIAPNIYRNS